MASNTIGDVTVAVWVGLNSNFFFLLKDMWDWICVIYENNRTFLVCKSIRFCPNPFGLLFLF